jgi:hypothetical protein
MVKEQLNHFIIKKAIEDKCKGLLAWWKLYEQQLFNVSSRFVA